MMQRKNLILVAIILAVVVLQGLTLYAVGNPVICPCGHIKIWDSSINSPDNSQHLLDWYTFSHIIFGFAIYFALWLFGSKKRGWSLFFMLLVVVLISTTWEIFENTHFAVSRFQHTAIYSNYYGDSIVNSVVDTTAAVVGFLLAFYLPLPVTIALAVALEIIIGYATRDNLTISIINFIHPIRSIVRWQGG